MCNREAIRTAKALVVFATTASVLQLDQNLSACIPSIRHCLRAEVSHSPPPPCPKPPHPRLPRCTSFIFRKHPTNTAILHQFHLPKTSTNTTTPHQLHPQNIHPTPAPSTNCIFKNHQTNTATPHQLHLRKKHPTKTPRTPHQTVCPLLYPRLLDGWRSLIAGHVSSPPSLPAQPRHRLGRGRLPGRADGRDRG